MRGGAPPGPPWSVGRWGPAGLSAPALANGSNKGGWAPNVRYSPRFGAHPPAGRLYCRS
ncbi:MAG: hypothetical protein QOD71_2112 [Thermoleophilaceae bacterium]|nr:hypothetical protein [Thermoleophilaceae bacterium]